MPRNGSGGYSAPTNSWNPATVGNSATPPDFNALLSDIATAISQSIAADGQTPITANIPMGSNKLTGLSQGVAAGDSLAWEQLFSQGVETDVASAATCDIGAVNSAFIRITGTTTITSFGTNYRGPRFVRFAGVLQLTHNASTLILPGGVNITTAAGDCAIFRPIGSPASGWALVALQRASGLAAQSGANSDITSLGALASVPTVVTTAINTATADKVKFAASVTVATTSGISHDFNSIATWAQRITVVFDLVSTNGSDQVAIQLGTAASFSTTGYQGSSAYIGPSLGSSLASNIGTGGFAINLTGSSSTRTGKITIDRVAGNVWQCSGMIGDTSSGNLIFVAGRKSLSDVLTRIRLTTVSGIDVFDGGQVTVTVEGW